MYHDEQCKRSQSGLSPDDDEQVGTGHPDSKASVDVINTTTEPTVVVHPYTGIISCTLMDERRGLGVMGGEEEKEFPHGYVAPLPNIFYQSSNAIFKVSMGDRHGRMV